MSQQSMQYPMPMGLDQSQSQSQSPRHGRNQSRGGSQDTLTDGLGNQGPQGMEKGASDLSGLSADDPENPMNFPLYRKVYVSSVASAFNFAYVFGLTAISAGVPGIIQEFGVSQVSAILAFSIPFFGLIGAPLLTPHLTELGGRTPVMYGSMIIQAFCILGASRVDRFPALLALRFLAGFLGSPLAIALEGTYADLWSATFTGSYQAFIMASQFLGGSVGAVVAGVVVQAQSNNWRWSQYVPLMLDLVVLIYGVGVPETFNRQIIRVRARRAGRQHSLPPAGSGATPLEALKITFIQPALMLVLDPIVASLALFMAFNWGVLFQFFVLVPNVLNMLANFGARQSGLAFLSAVAAVGAAWVTGILLDHLGVFVTRRRNSPDFIEHRLMAAIIGSMSVTGSLWAVGAVVNPNFPVTSGVVATGFYVYGTSLNLMAVLSYLDDLFAPPEAISALSTVAYSRVITAGWFPLIITAGVARFNSRVFFIFGGISIAMLMIPIVLFVFGPKLRSKSRFNTGSMNTLQLQQMSKENRSASQA